MDLDKKYKDAEGEECNILDLVKKEPEWAANRIQHYETIGRDEFPMDFIEGELKGCYDGDSVAYDNMRSFIFKLRTIIGL